MAHFFLVFRVKAKHSKSSISVVFERYVSKLLQSNKSEAALNKKSWQDFTHSHPSVYAVSYSADSLHGF